MRARRFEHGAAWRTESFDLSFEAVLHLRFIGNGVAAKAVSVLLASRFPVLPEVREGAIAKGQRGENESEPNFSEHLYPVSFSKDRLIQTHIWRHSSSAVKS